MARLLSLLLFFASISHASWEGSLLLEEGWGALHGYTQIPKGGSFGSTSTERPSFNEMDLSHNPLFHARCTFARSHAFLFSDYYRFTPQQDTYLNYDLLTHSQFIPAGRSFFATVHYNWYQIGFGWDTPVSSSQWHIKPSIGIDWLKFMYHFIALPIESRRHFNLLTGSAGLAFEFPLRPQWPIEISGKASLPVSRLQLYTLALASHYAMPLTSHVVFCPRLSLGVIYLDYRDGQIIPNHFRYEMAPYASLGFILRGVAPSNTHSLPLLRS